jgi:hypothetical protein
MMPVTLQVTRATLSCLTSVTSICEQHIRVVQGDNAPTRIMQTRLQHHDSSLTSLLSSGKLQMAMPLSCFFKDPQPLKGVEALAIKGQCRQREGLSQLSNAVLTDHHCIWVFEPLVHCPILRRAAAKVPVLGCCNVLIHGVHFEVLHRCIFNVKLHPTLLEGHLQLPRGG